jgi:hypothetical protein
MEVPKSLKLNSDIFEPKGLYYFSSEALNTAVRHYFVIVEIEGKLFHMVVCTTQFEKRKEYLNYAGIDSCTLVPIKPDTGNELTEECYVDCNKVFSHYTIEALQAKLDSGVLAFKGHVSDSEYYQIMNGIIYSPRVEKAVIAVIKNTFDKFNE